MDNNSGRIIEYFNSHKDGFYIDDITCNDVDLDAVFDEVNRTYSSLGDEILYHMLRTPSFDREKLNELEGFIEHYSEDSPSRNKTVSILKGISKLKKISVFDYLDKIGEVKSIGNIVLYIPFALILIGIILCFFNSLAGIIFLVLAFGINTVRYFRLLKDVKPYLICFAYIFKAISVSPGIEGITPDETKGLLSLTRGNFILGNLSGVSANGGAGNPFDLLLDLLRMSLHLDIIRFYHLTDRAKNEKERIASLLEHIGRIDSYISIGEFRKDVAYYSLPVFTDEKHIKCDDLYHPLLKDPVPNSIDTHRGVLITGSNASGKSTFLRSLAINILFAQTINTVLARSYEAPLCSLITSMSLRDDLLKGDSFYMAEIKSVRRILDPSYRGDSRYVISFVDELLKGTNTLERIATSSKILSELGAEDIICFAATHDIELTSILKDRYDNYHFSEDMTEKDDIHFSYKLMEGPSTTTNAIKLLIALDFPESIIDEAIEMVQRYKTTGAWQL
ncbi:MAG: hypothetical protein K5888_06525 [Lachnospiraceae bacterium]|nr:hypothetical protein [Lachnospiraceae bacterium]